MRIGFLGGGYMGEALAAAFISSGLVESSDITVSDIAQVRRDHLASAYGLNVTEDNGVAVAGADIVVLAVKPQEFSNVAAGLKGKLEQGQTLLSIMAGVEMARISEETGHVAVVRVMPNTAAFVGQAMSVWTASDAVPAERRREVAALLDSLGAQREVSDEAVLDMATAVSGSGPGFVFLFLESMIDAGVSIGLAPEIAEELATQMLVGAATMARELDKTPAELREMVTSKGGTTAAGLSVLDQAGFRAIIDDTIKATYDRAKEL